MSAGTLGDSIRVGISYNTPTPESTFNVVLFQSTVDSRGQRVQTNREVWNNLTMDPNSSSYAPTVLTQKSALVSASDPATVARIDGYSMSTKPIIYDSSVANAADFRAKFAAALGATSPQKSFRISVNGNPSVVVTITDDFTNTVAFPGTTVAALETQFATAIANRIDAALTGGITVNVTIAAGPVDAAPLATAVLIIDSTAQGDILVQSGPANDAAAALGLGAANGGTEVSSYSVRRPAPTGVVYNAYERAALATASEFLNLPQTGGTAINAMTLDAFDAAGNLVPQAVPLALADPAPPAGAANWQGSPLTTKLQRWADAVNAFQAMNPSTFRWTAELWGTRIAFIPTAGDDNTVPPFATAPSNIATAGPPTIVNVRYDSLGLAGAPLFQTAGVAGNDGNPPTPADYDAAYVVIDHDVDLFNLLILPPERSTGAVAVQTLYANASIFCQQRRAFLVMDPPDSWTSAQSATSGVNTFRIGMVKDYSAVYFPRLTINEGGLNVVVGPAGGAAGIYARTDASRGVWKAPAGTEADFRGVTGVDLNLTDGESGQIQSGRHQRHPGHAGRRAELGRADQRRRRHVRQRVQIHPDPPPRPLHGGEPLSRTQMGGVRAQRHTALGLDPAQCWFLHAGTLPAGRLPGVDSARSLLRQVRRRDDDADDRDLGIVNIWVGFALLQPAEFVVLYIQQIAGALQT